MGRFRSIDVGTGANAKVVKAGPGRILRWYMFNVASSVRYVKFYDQTTAPNVGTDPVSMTIPVPAGGGSVVDSDKEGWGFTNGIGIGATQNVADNDTVAPTTNDVICNIDFV